MTPLARARLLAQLLRWRLTWDRHDSSYVEPGLDDPRFRSALDAVGLIRDGDVVFSTGMAASARCSIFYFALKERFAKTGHPRDLTWVALGAMGGRGRAPGTIEECDAPGLITRYIGGHLETAKAILRNADLGRTELHNLPQGVMGFLLEAQARGESSLLSDTGVGSFLDPRVGEGSQVLAGVGESLIQPEGDKLRYTLPPLDVALVVAPYADREGNLYAQHAATLTEIRAAALAAKAHGGRVLATVSDVVEKDEARVYIPAAHVDAVVVNPWNEQTGPVRQRRYWPLFTVGAKVDVDEGVAALRLMNRLAGITPRRSEPDRALARLAASWLPRLVKPGAMVNMGTGLPEEVAFAVQEGGLLGDVTFATETGVIGGVPGMGVFFGTAVGPTEMVESTEIFHRWSERLDLTILGMLQADSEGNVNVSKRGERAIDFVGVGGFPDLVRAAETILFVGAWMTRAKLAIREGRLVVERPGAHKFTTAVDQVTFSGPRGLELGKNVYYATHVGVFHLTRRGMELVQVMPGVDIGRDILDACPMRVVPPEGTVPVVPAEVVTGRGFRLAWPV